MLFTTLTTSTGFASLALTPIPPVQVFGVLIAIGMLLARLWSIFFIPADFMLALAVAAGTAALPVAEPADFITV